MSSKVFTWNEAERQSSLALGAQVDLLTKCLDEAKAIELSVAKLYISALDEFGGIATSLPLEPSPYSLFA